MLKTFTVDFFLDSEPASGRRTLERSNRSYVLTEYWSLHILSCIVFFSFHIFLSFCFQFFCFTILFTATYQTDDWPSCHRSHSLDSLLLQLLFHTHNTLTHSILHYCISTVRCSIPHLTRRPPTYNDIRQRRHFIYSLIGGILSAHFPQIT